ncbi:MAG: carboxylating nicotinate-nucleotide diphosphorylase [Gemmatimonadetes bacterium]|nr:carboxylating nicotinate-nucleotide diphosphorylase [Gemmatimonadota bacterium]
MRFPLKPDATTALVRAALDEDQAHQDLTSIATIAKEARARAKIVARTPGVLAGIALAIEAFRQLDPKVTLRIDAEDGTALERGTEILFVSGHARGILGAERVALNFLQRLSGVASLTAKYVAAVRGTGARILDTRKTTPGWRHLEKYAVRCGGGTNHRMDLAAAVLIKDNHIAALDGNVRAAIERARALAPAGTSVEVECDTLEQVDAAVGAGADIILLDNMTTDELVEAVRIVGGRAQTEASGGVRLETVRAIAETGVTFVSVGAITHSAPALDLALDFE